MKAIFSNLPRFLAIFLVSLLFVTNNYAHSASLTTPPLTTVPLNNEGSWPDLRYDIVEDAQIRDGSALFTVELPVRAEDAATVPIRIVQIDDSKKIEQLQIIIDENPAPVAALFSFGKTVEKIDFETRLRVNQYSNVRVLALIEGVHYMNGGYVKASGGCSAPASKDPEEALNDIGKMRLRHFEASDLAASLPLRSSQLMIRHPNYSGLQRDQVSHLFVPARFIHTLDVSQGKDLIFDMKAGISISENPIFRFSYGDNGATSISVTAIDTEGSEFAQEFEKTATEN